VAYFRSQKYTRGGTQKTSRTLRDLLPEIVGKLHCSKQVSFEPLLTLWQEIVDKKVAQMTRPLKIEEGTLFVTVKNSLVLGLLQNPVEKERILSILKANLPCQEVKNIIFRIGK
jgi:predicted nucleic acid-binding Zn ribbon protein